MERQLTGYRNRAFVFFTNPIIQFFFLGGGGGGLVLALRQWISSSLKHDSPKSK